MVEFQPSKLAVRVQFPSPAPLFCFLAEGWPSGQWQQTVNLPALAFAGSNPAPSTSLKNNFTFLLILCLKISNYYFLQ